MASYPFTSSLFLPSVALLVPSGDRTGLADSAAIASMLGAGQAVTLLPGAWYTSGPILLSSSSVLTGFGSSTVIQPGSAFTGSYMTQLASPASTVRVTLRGVTFSINWAAGVGGVQIDNTGYSDPGGPLGLPDPAHVLQDIMIIRAAGDAYHFDNNARELRVTNCRQYNGLGYGFYLGDAGGVGAGCTDSHFTDCTSAQSGNHGFYVLSQNNMFANCKSFGSGNNQSTGVFGITQCGFELSGSSCNKNTFVGCSAQQNGLHGFDMQACSQVTLTGCEADSNSAGTGAAGGVGFNSDAATQCAVVACVGVQSTTPGNQQYGLAQAGQSSQTYYALNTVKGTTGSFQFVSGGGYFLINGANITDLTSFNVVRFGQVELYEASTQALTNGATIMPSAGNGSYPVSSTANVTGIIIAAPSGQAAIGTILVVINTTGFTVTFAAAGASNVADGTADVIAANTAACFTWDTNTSLWYRNY